MILIVYGTRPEAIKLVILYKMMKSAGMEVKACFTGQHKDLVGPIHNLFEVAPDISFSPEGSTLTERSASIMVQMERVIQEHKPDWVVTQ